MRVAAFICISVIALVATPSAQTGVIDRVRSAIAAGDLPRAEQLARADLKARPTSPEALAALSWVARGALAANELALADRVALDTEARVESLLEARPLDAEEHLPIALGAALEVQANVLAAQGNRSEAVYLLTRALERYGDTSVHARLQKNRHLLSLVGKPALPLDTREFLGRSGSAIPLTGRPLLLFFWAHWCSDCKLQGAMLPRLLKEFAPDGLAIVAPTQRYGYIGARENVAPAEERRHITTIRQEFYRFLDGVPIPMSAQNFRNYGVSSTPTLVLVDRAGIVRLYHPGGMSERALRTALRDLVAEPRASSTVGTRMPEQMRREPVQSTNVQRR